MTITQRQRSQTARTDATRAEVPHPEPALGAMPDTRAVNFYTSDPYLQFVLRRRLGEDERNLVEPRLRALGARVGSELVIWPPKPIARRPC